MNEIVGAANAIQELGVTGILGLIVVVEALVIKILWRMLTSCQKARIDNAERRA